MVKKTVDGFNSLGDYQALEVEIPACERAME